jgi:hypothetical protein
MKSDPDEDFFIGWAPTSKGNRRFLLAGGIGLIASGMGLISLLGNAHEPVGLGQWDQGQTVNLTGIMVNNPWPHLLMLNHDLGVKSVYLVGSGKLRLEKNRLFSDGILVKATGSLIKRGHYAMMAITDINSNLKKVNSKYPLTQNVEIDEGSVLLSGEILDAKCWFGAMRPSSGKVHKACASLCVRGGLPVAFCSSGCGDESELLTLVRPDGTAHSYELLPYVADPVVIEGRIVRVNGMKQLRAKISDIRFL